MSKDDQATVLVCGSIDMRSSGYSQWWVVEFRNNANEHCVMAFTSRSDADRGIEGLPAKPGSTIYLRHVLARIGENATNVKGFTRENSCLLAAERGVR